MSQCPALSHLVGGYLHHDWDIVHGSPESAVTAFVRGESAAPQVPGEIAELLSTADDDELRRLILDEYFSGYNPERRGKSLRQWLTEVAEQITKELAARGDATNVDD